MGEIAVADGRYALMSALVRLALGKSSDGSSDGANQPDIATRLRIMQRGHAERQMQGDTVTATTLCLSNRLCRSKGRTESLGDKMSAPLRNTSHSARVSLGQSRLPAITVAFLAVFPPRTHPRQVKAPISRSASVSDRLFVHPGIHLRTGGAAGGVTREPALRRGAGTTGGQTAPRALPRVPALRRYFGCLNRPANTASAHPSRSSGRGCSPKDGSAAWPHAPASAGPPEGYRRRAGAKARRTGSSDPASP